MHRIAFLALASLVASPALARPGPELTREGPWAVTLVDERGAPLPTFLHRGRTYVLGTRGQRYLVRVRNPTARRVEVVVSVDGRDVIDGKPASLARRGYLVEPWGELAVDGYRLSESAVAAFRFSSVPRSYAARTGSARDVGVIGVAVYPEREARVPVPRSIPDDAERGAEESAPRAESPAPAPPAARSGASARADGKASRRPGLGTEFGEQHASPVIEVPFERARSTADAVVTLRYDDRAGLRAMGIDVDGRRREAWLRETANPFRESGWAEPPPRWRP